MGEISIEHINILSSKCISNEPIQVKFAPDFGINSNNPDTKSKHESPYVNKVMCNKVEWNRKKVLNTLTEINSILSGEAFVCNDSFKALSVWSN